MGKQPPFRAYPQDIFSEDGSPALDLAEIGLYMLALSHCSKKDSLPMEDEHVSRALALPFVRFSKLWPKVSERFPIYSDRRRRNPHQLADREEAAEKSKKARESAMIRYGKKAATPKAADPVVEQRVMFPDVVIDREKGYATLRQPPKDMAEGFDAWWQLWSSGRGSNHHNQAVQAWLSVMQPLLVAPCMDCTKSYLESQRNGTGYNPENFLFDQAKEFFTARWVPRKSGDVAALARKRWDEEGDI